MEEENKSTIKKYLPFIAIAVVAVIAIIVIAVTLGGKGSKKKDDDSKKRSGPEGVVEDYIDAYNDGDIKDVMKCFDIRGYLAWSDNYYSASSFEEEDLEDFEKDYEEIEDDEVEYYESSREYSVEYAIDAYEKDYKSYEFIIKDIDSEEIADELYKVTTEINLKTEAEDEDDNIDVTRTITFVVYNDKIIYGSL